MPVPDDVFRDQPVLTGPTVRLEPLTEAVLEDYLVMLADPEGGRFTGSRAPYPREKIVDWLRTRGMQPDRCDWVAIRRRDGAFLGEAVLNELEPADACANYRIYLHPAHRDAGHGTEITRLVLDHAFAAGLHRVELGVFAFNERARRVYEKCGFRLEGRARDKLWWDGEWHDDLMMAVLADDPR